MVNYMNYMNLKQSTFGSGKLVPIDYDVVNNIDNSKDWYTSIFVYRQEHKELFEKTNKLAGITDVVTNRLVFDFDSGTDLQKAKNDALSLLNLFNKKYQIEPSNFEIYFSGKKGFTLEAKLAKSITPFQFKVITNNLAKRYKTLDTKITDAQRIIRVPNTTHQSSGLYKIPIPYTKFLTVTIEEILEKAKSSHKHRFNIMPINLPKELFHYEKPKMIQDPTREKPKFLTDCKWSIQNGNYNDGERNNCLMALASSYNYLGYDARTTTKILEAAEELRVERTQGDPLSESEVEAIVGQIYSDTWNGGTYSCRGTSDPLYNYCSKNHGEEGCLRTKEVDNGKVKPKTLMNVSGPFEDFIKNIEKNTITTGYKFLDETMPITVGSNVGLIGAPGSGKTAIALNILRHTSRKGIKTVFASLDMHPNRMFEKVIYSLTGISRHDLYAIFKKNVIRKDEILKKVDENFGNVFFYDRSLPTVQDIKDYILDCEKESGEKVKLLMLDYFERVSSEYSDDTQGSKKIAGELQNLVNDLNIAIIVIVQPNKYALSGGVDTAIRDYTKIKGSSFIYQAFRQIVSIWRPGYNPEDPKNDKFMQMAILKNDLGELDEKSYHWNGKRGFIRDLENNEDLDLKELLESKTRKKNNAMW